MVPRFTGPSLGLLAFAVTILAGLYVGNPPMVILSRSILALFGFCVIGLALGRAAQAVLSEYERRKREEFERSTLATQAKTNPESVKEVRVGPSTAA